MLLELMLSSELLAPIVASDVGIVPGISVDISVGIASGIPVYIVPGWSIEPDESEDVSELPTSAAAPRANRAANAIIAKLNFFIFNLSIEIGNYRNSRVLLASLQFTFLVTRSLARIFDPPVWNVLFLASPLVQIQLAK